MHDVAAHGSPHSPAPRVALTLALVMLYFVTEVVGSWFSHSLALLADAGHMLSDAGALGVTLFALWIARQPPNPTRTYGYYRAEILAAFINGTALVGISLWLLIEAVQRLRTPQPVEGEVLTIVAAGGLLVNLISMVLLHRDRAHSLNLRAAWLHVASDALGSISALASGLAIWAFGWTWADSVATLLITGLVVYSAWQLTSAALAVLLEGAPPHIALKDVRAAIAEVDGVLGVHDLHVWTIASGFEILTCHVVTDDVRKSPRLLHELGHILHERFGLDHVTIQIEPLSEAEVVALSPAPGAKP